MLEEQIRLEEEQETAFIQKCILELENSVRQGRFDTTSSGTLLMKLGYEPLVSKLSEYLEGTYKGTAEKDKNYLLLLCDDSKELAYIILKTVVSGFVNPKYQKLVAAINLLMDNLSQVNFLNRLQKENPKLHSYLGNEYRRASARRKRQLITKHIKYLKGDGIHVGRSKEENTRVGARLIDILIKSGANIIEKRRSRVKGDRWSSFSIVPTEEAYNVIKMSLNRDKMLLNSTMLPLVCEPKDWTSLSDGGYIKIKRHFITQRWRKRTAQMVLDTDFKDIFRVINKLQKTSWRVNTKVLDVVDVIFTNNMVDPRSSKEAPRLYGDLPTANRTSIEEMHPKKPDMSKEEWRVWNNKREMLTIEQDGEASRRLKVVTTLASANKMKEYPKIWFAYRVDYRGRVYPMNDHLSPQGSTLTKSLLEFGEGRYLTVQGIYWLKIHIANTYGNDKMLLKDRILWVEENHKNILKVAEDWRSNISLWASADKPFEYLASCYAYEEYTEGKKIHLPIQLDAINSGLQMYSGLLLDGEGASRTAVIPTYSEGKQVRPDVYTMIADKVNELIPKYPSYIGFLDKTGTDKLISTADIKKEIVGKVDRAFVKRNIMTIPYSVTLRGMQMQNLEYMDKLKQKNKVFWKGDSWVVNKIITDCILQASKELLTSATLGQTFLRDIAKLQKHPVYWKTPIYNFPVYQNFYKQKSIRVTTVLGSLRLYIDDTVKVDKGKQSSGVAANFIHSIDATLLMYCIDHMSEHIGVIHDCFNVHPNDGDEIRKHYKEGYIKIMRERPFESISKELDPEGKIEVPLIGTLDLDEVRDSEYIIS